MKVSLVMGVTMLVLAFGISAAHTFCFENYAPYRPFLISSMAGFAAGKATVMLF